MYLIFVSSLNENVKLANKIKQELQKENKESKIINLVELNLPMYDSFKEEHDGIPKIIYELIQEMKKAKAYIFVSPEYNFSLPPVLVNFVAWVSRVGDDFRELFSLKFIQLATHAGGAGENVANAMRNQFTKLGSILAPREIITNYQKPLNEESLKRILKQFLLLTK